MKVFFCLSLVVKKVLQQFVLFGEQYMVSADRLTPTTTNTALHIQEASEFDDHMGETQNIDEHVVQNERNSRFSSMHWRPFQTGMFQFIELEEDNFFDFQRLIGYRPIALRNRDRIQHNQQDSDDDSFTTFYQRAYTLIDFDSAFIVMSGSPISIEIHKTPQEKAQQKSTQQMKFEYFVKKEQSKEIAKTFKLRSKELIRYQKMEEKIEQKNYLKSPQISTKENRRTKYQIILRTSSSM